MRASMGRSEMNGTRKRRVWMRFRAIAALLTLGFLFVPAVSGAAPPEAMKTENLVGTYEKLVKMKADAADEIRRLDRAIEQNNRTIAKTEDIIRQAQTQGKGDAEQIGRQARSKALEAKRKNEAARAAAEMRSKRADDALRTVSSLMASPDGTVPRVDCAALLSRWQNDPARKASQDCECFDPERPPMCVSKGTKMPGLKEGGYSFYWILEFRTAEGQMNITDGSHSGKYKTYDAALRDCQDEARRALDPIDHVVNLVCIPTVWPETPQVKATKPPPVLKQGN
jgi:TolA-binding protein